MFAIVCPSCGQIGEFPDEKMGALANCPHCKVQFFVSKPDKPAESLKPRHERDQFGPPVWFKHPLWRDKPK